MSDRVRVLLLTGTVGAGKTTLAYEINDALAEMEVPNAAIDLDALTAQWPPSSPWNSDLMFDNLASVWPNYRARGTAHLVLAHVLEDASEKDRYRHAVPGAELTVARVVAPEPVRKQRLRGRMPPGASLQWHLHRTTELESILEAAGHEDFLVENGHGAIREVALSTLARAGWL